MNRINIFMTQLFASMLTFVIYMCFVIAFYTYIYYNKCTKSISRNEFLVNNLFIFYFFLSKATSRSRQKGRVFIRHVSVFCVKYIVRFVKWNEIKFLSKFCVVHKRSRRSFSNSRQNVRLGILFKNPKGIKR